VVRAEACAADFYSALDLAIAKLSSRMRRAADRRRVHRGRHAPVSVASATAALAAADPTLTGVAAQAGGVALAERAAANDLTEHDKVLTGLTLALGDRDAETILRILEATDLARITNTGVAYPKAWFQALAERLRGNKSASQAAFLIARTDIENAVAADPGNGRKLGVLAIIDAGLEHYESAIAEALPDATITGFDYHPASIEAARRAADKAGVGDRVSFEATAAKDYPGTGYDLVTFFDCLHDMGDPVGAAAHIRRSLAADGTWLIVEPFAGDTAAENLNPVGRVYYSFSNFLCVPNAKSQAGGHALGAQAGEAALREVALAAGFTRFRRAAETPFNIVLEARP